MTDFGIYTKNADIQAEAGTNANATEKATAATDVYVLNVESTINVLSNFNWSDAFGTLNADVKSAVTLYTASGVAQDAINYDSDAIGQSTAELRLDKLESNIRKALKAIKEKSKQAWAVDVT
ncbi:hypothetical protein LCGC14_2161540 [marine sediment metagenome]|uniref:Uncharacterized protein n=1 Tax=marine sediment metagenome TaxID=412755 RepID=A0A0F9GNU8_9ZZZZ